MRTPKLSLAEINKYLQDWMIKMTGQAQRIRSKYVYGVSATPMRSDKLEKINYMLLGPIRHEYSAKEQAESLKISLYAYPRFTRALQLEEGGLSYQTAIDKLCENEDRNDQIVQDVKCCITQKRTPVILTGRKKHRN